MSSMPNRVLVPGPNGTIQATNIQDAIDELVPKRDYDELLKRVVALEDAIAEIYLLGKVEEIKKNNA